MKIIFGYTEKDNLGVVEYFEVKLGENDSSEISNGYKEYLLPSVVEDFHHIAIFDEYYNKVKAVRNKEMTEINFGGNQYNHFVTLDEVKIRRKSDNKSWSCEFDAYRKILKGWKEFTGLKRKPQTQIEVRI